MGMLMHHTWLEQQKKKDAEQKPVAKEVDKAIEEIAKEESESARKSGRRKSSKYRGKPA